MATLMEALERGIDLHGNNRKQEIDLHGGRKVNKRRQEEDGGGTGIADQGLVLADDATDALYQARRNVFHQWTLQISLLKRNCISVEGKGEHRGSRRASVATDRPRQSRARSRTPSA